MPYTGELDAAKYINPDVRLDTINLIYDADSNAYPTMKIGNYVWMADNLRTTKCRNGNQLGTSKIGFPNVNATLYWLNDESTGPDAKEYGPMYNWAAVRNCDICPKKFRIPSEEDWRNLIRYWFGRNGTPAGEEGLIQASYRLREPGQRLWSSRYNYRDTIPALGFDAKPGGWMENNELLYYRERTAWWGFKEGNPYCLKIADGDGGIWTAAANEHFAMYVRCVKYK